MKIQPVLKLQEPNYPKLEEFVNSPNFFINNAPDKWKNSKIVWAALVSMAISNQGCGNGFNKHSRIEIIQLQENKTDKFSTAIESLSDSSFVTPLFQHGKGIGVYGCIVIMPPVFINEQEAKQIILNELKKANLNFDTISQPDHKIVVKTTKKYWEEKNGKYKERDTTELNNLTFDGYNKELNFAFCFVSNKNYKNFTDYVPEHSSVSEEDFKRTAEKLRMEIKKANNVNAVIFYEPLPYPKQNNNSERLNRKDWQIEGTKIAVDSLKAQVMDFVNWLKTEKITLK